MSSLIIPLATGANDAQITALAEAAIAAHEATKYPPFKAGQFLTPHSLVYGGDFTTSARLANVLHLTPFWVPFAIPVNQIGIEVVTTPSSAATGARLGLAILDPEDPWAATLGEDYGTVLTDSTGEKTIAIAQTFVPGVLYGALVATQANVTLRAHTKSADVFGNATAGGATTNPSLTMAHTYGALPTDMVFTSTSVAPVAVRFRVV